MTTTDTPGRKNAVAPTTPGPTTPDYVYFVSYTDGTSFVNCFVPISRPITTKAHVEALRDHLRGRGFGPVVVLSFVLLPDEHLNR